MEGLSIVCPRCKQSILETTEEFNPLARPDGSMVRLKPQYKRWRWRAFPFRKHVGWRQMLCTKRHHLCSHGKFVKILNPDGTPFVFDIKDYMFERPKDQEYEVQTFTDEDLDREWNERMGISGEVEQVEQVEKPKEQDPVFTGPIEKRKPTVAEGFERMRIEKEIVKLKSQKKSYADIAKRLDMEPKEVKKIYRANKLVEK